MKARATPGARVRQGATPMDRNGRPESPGYPDPLRWLGATALAVVLSVLADALIVRAGTAFFPSTVGYTHFRVGDYATLTIIGVVVACAGWPAVIAVSPSPRRVYRRLAVAVTLILWIPDLVLISRHQPPRAVAVLMVMHLSIAVVTYTVMVRLAPAGDRPGEPGAFRSAAAGPGGQDGPEAAGPQERGTGPSERSPRRWATPLAGLVGVEFALGILTLVVVPTDRASGWLPAGGRAAYLVHAVVGVPLTMAAVTYLVAVRNSARIDRLSGWIGGAGVGLAGAGGFLTVAHPLRLVGLALMLVGSVAAGFGYLLPALDRLTETPPPAGGGAGAGAGGGAGAGDEAGAT